MVCPKSSGINDSWTQRWVVQVACLAFSFAFETQGRLFSVAVGGMMPVCGTERVAVSVCCLFCSCAFHSKVTTAGKE